MTRHGTVLDSITVVLGNSNVSAIIRFAEVPKGLAKLMLSVLCLFFSTVFPFFRSRISGCLPTAKGEAARCGLCDVAALDPLRSLRCGARADRLSTVRLIL